MKGKSVKKFLSAVLVGTMTASLLAGCGGSSGGGGSEDSKDSESDKAASDSGVDLSGVEAIADIGYEGDPIELSFWYLQTRQEGTEVLTEVFNKANPNINVTVSFYDTDGIKDSCKTAAQSGSLPSMWFNWGGALGQYYVDNDVTYELTEN